MANHEPIPKNPYCLDPVPDGQYCYTDEDDESLLVKTFRNGKLHGLSLWHYSSGELWIEQTYRNGVPHGTTNYYEKSGSLHKSEQWWRGRFIGPGLEEGDTWQGYLKWTFGHGLKSVFFMWCFVSFIASINWSVINPNENHNLWLPTIFTFGIYFFGAALKAVQICLIFIWRFYQYRESFSDGMRNK